jgi:hypothetical protein
MAEELSRRSYVWAAGRAGEPRDEAGRYTVANVSPGQHDITIT